MPSKQTSNYQLSQWSKSDKVLMGDFNADNAKTDAALAGLAARVAALERFEHIRYGSFEGLNNSVPRTFPLPWAPKFAILFGRINNEAAVALLTPECVRYINTAVSDHDSIYTPKLSGSDLKVNHWFNHETTHYIIFR